MDSSLRPANPSEEPPAPVAGTGGFSAYSEARLGTRRKTSHEGRAVSRHKATQAAAKKQDSLNVAIQAYYGREVRRAAHKAQHGPVRVIVKDGQPVETANASPAEELKHAGGHS